MSSLASHLPPHVRRRLGRYKRAILRQPPPPVRPSPPKIGPKATPAAKPVTPPDPPKPRLQVRRDFIFATANRADSILEIGPAHNAILPKREGFNTKNVDYLDRGGLVEKYRSYQQYSPDDIEEVDFVLAPGAAMSDAINERFDVVLASHVLEHSTSLVHFINELTKLLTDGGVLSLVVPDHRYCFDRFRERSSLGRVIDASHNPPSVHSAGTLAEFTLNAVKHRGTTSWAPGHWGKYEFVHNLDAAKAWLTREDDGVYVDVHNWIFSPNHLRLLLQDLYDLDLITVREALFQNTIGHEFFINLTVDAPGTGLTRQDLLMLADNELRSLDIPEWEPEATA